MISGNKKIKFIFLKKKIQKKNEFLKNFIKKSIIQNKELNFIVRNYIKTFLISKNELKRICILDKNKKNINKKSKLSRFAVHKINCNNLNQNFKIYEK